MQDRRISTFSRGPQPAFAGINTFLKAPYCEDIREVGRYDAAVIGVPFDMGTTYRSGCRFGPQAVRRISAVYDSYSLDLGVDLDEELALCDAGDVFVIPSNIEKTFDQIDRAISHVVSQGVFPVIIGGDHSIGYPDVRAISKYVDGNVGIIHFDRHIDIQERDMDERMHTTHWFHATNIPNVPPENLVQIGIGGWYGSRPGALGRLRARHHGHDDRRRREAGHRQGRGDRARGGVEGRGRGVPLVRHRFGRRRDRPGHGLTRARGSAPPRGAARPAEDRARGHLRMEVIEISPPYDTSDSTAQLGCRAIMDVLGVLVAEGKLGTRAPGDGT